MYWILELCALLPFYLLGSFPSGKIVAALRGVKIEQHGSKNVGATNVARVLGAKSGLVTLALDVLKGMLAVKLGWIVSHSYDFHAYAGLAAVLGHCFSIPGKLKGGKGVATSLGVLLALAPITAAISLTIFALVIVITRYVSLSSVLAACSAPIFLLLTPSQVALQYATIGMAALITYRHLPNLLRLAEGREPKFGEKMNYEAICNDSGAK